MRRSLIVVLAILDEAATIIIVVVGAAYLADRLGVLTPFEAAIAASPLALFLAVASAKAVTAASMKPRTGPESITGKKGRVLDASGGSIVVEIEGEIWRARVVNGGDVREGDLVIVKGVDGLTLLVEPVGKGGG